MNSDIDDYLKEPLRDEFIKTALAPDSFLLSRPMQAAELWRKAFYKAQNANPCQAVACGVTFFADLPKTTENTPIARGLRNAMGETLILALEERRMDQHVLSTPTLAGQMMFACLSNDPHDLKLFRRGLNVLIARQTHAEENLSKPGNYHLVSDVVGDIMQEMARRLRMRHAADPARKPAQAATLG